MPGPAIFACRWTRHNAPVPRKPYRVAVVTTYDLTRAGLVSILNEHPDHVVLDDVASQDGHLGGHDVVLYDLAALNESTYSDLQHLVASRAPVVGLVPHARHDLAERALDSGVDEIVPLGVTTTELLRALERAATGNSPTRRAQLHEQRRTLKGLNGLTEREAVILALIASGRSNQEVAEELYVSLNTVKSYIRTAYGKIGAKSRSQAVLWVVANLDEGPGNAGPSDEGS